MNISLGKEEVGQYFPVFVSKERRIIVDRTGLNIYYY